MRFPSKHKAIKKKSKGVFNRTVNLYYELRKWKEKAFIFDAINFFKPISEIFF